MAHPKASVAVAIIAKNAEKTIGDAVKSLLPYVEAVVVCVDAASTDGTARVARRAGAKVYPGHPVSEPHECPAHGRVMAQHFAKARDASFEKLKLYKVDWYMWVDADDHVEGGEKLAEYLKGLAPEIGVVWLPYFYASAG